MQPLSGIKVIESGSYITGPYASMLLADLGAEVVKIERPSGGDPYRAFKGGTCSTYFRTINRNKKSLTVDINKPEGQEIVRRLAARSDLFLENTRPGFMEGLKLGYEQLRDINARLVYVSITGFGQNGPYRDRPSFDTVAQALSGLLSLSIDPKDPRVTGTALSDGITGLYGCYAAMAGLAMRERIGKGVRIETNMIAASMAFVEFWLVDYLLTKTVPDTERKSAGSQSFGFRCADGKLVAIHMSSPEKFWTGLVAAVETPGLATDPRFSTRAGRMENYQALRAELGAIFVRQPRAHWLKRLVDADVPFAPIYGVDEVSSDPQVQAMDLFYQLRHPKAEATPALKRPVLVDGKTDYESATPPPLLGEHTEELLRSLQYTDAQIGKLKDTKVV